MNTYEMTAMYWFAMTRFDVFLDRCREIIAGKWRSVIHLSSFWRGSYFALFDNKTMPLGIP